MPNFIRTTMAATACAGLIALPAVGAHAVGAPTTSLSSFTLPAAAPASAPASAPADGAATATSKAAVVTPSAKPRLTKHERKLRIEHRRKVRRNHRVGRALHVAARQQGDPYRWGATGPTSFDCSGLMLYSFRAVGLHLPRTAAAQSGAVRHISRAHMRRGDLVFFTSGGHVYHVGIFDGWSHGRRIIIHAPYSGADVRKEAIWTNGWFPGTLRLS
ncbi:C40 family peptidase [Nocardioides sp. BP30]|uniref:C40 family peptidase n=1 Tax=Nocardioides sp. BP30 TaxID=3036374 RepID=UPI00246939CD|nr:C40 family peptidase [Nocardioides sp. BP30]WGL53497.1 C40 family peptidase [Nocardioides sp. BP30]